MLLKLCTNKCDLHFSKYQNDFYINNFWWLVKYQMIVGSKIKCKIHMLTKNNFISHKEIYTTNNIYRIQNISQKFDGLSMNFVLIFALFLLGFAISFFMLVQNQSPFDTFGRAFAKSLIMMIGEFEYEGQGYKIYQYMSIYVNIYQYISIYINIY